MIDIGKLSVDELRDLIEQLRRLGVVIQPSRKRFRDYESWDWSRTNVELAVEHNVSLPTVSNWRRRLGKTKQIEQRFEGWDWSKSDAELAREHKVSYSSVKYWRRLVGKPYARTPSVPVVPTLAKNKWEVRADWLVVDWNKPDIALAREIGCTREYVRQKRASLGIPKRLWHEAKFEQFKAAFGDRKQMSYSDLNGFKIAMATFGKYCTKLGIVRVSETGGQRPEPIFSMVNWKLPNKLLSKIWNKPAHTFANHRCNFHLGKPAFRHSSKKPIPAEFQAEADEERRRAEAYFASLTAANPVDKSG